MFTAKRWLTGRELQASLDITGVELLEMVQQGLPVYDQHGRPSSYEQLGWSNFGGPSDMINVSSNKDRNPPRARVVVVDIEGNRISNIDLAKFQPKEVEIFIKDNGMGGLLPGKGGRVSPPSISGEAVVNTPAGTSWGEIHLRVPNKDFLEVRHPGGMANIEVKDLGLSGYGTDYGKLWLMVLKLAARGGEMEAGPNKKAHISRLRHKIRKIIPGVDGDPIRYDKKMKVYKTSFSISGDAKYLLDKEI